MIEGEIMKVKTSYTGCDYITAGKVCDVKVSGNDEILIDDEGEGIDIIGPKWDSTCPHLDDEGYWEEVE